MQTLIDWLRQFFMDIWAWFGEQFAAVLASLDPIGLVVRATLRFVDLLPQPSADAPLVLASIRLSVVYAAKYIAYLDYFVDLPLFFTVATVVASIEVGLLTVRTWRFIRSFIT